MHLSSLDDLLPSENLVSDRQRYWFVRSNGGSMFSTFWSEGVIAIGYENISIVDIYKNIESKDALESLVKKRYSNSKGSSFRTSQIYRFFSEMKAGDIVVVPSFSSESLAVGRIKGNKVFNKTLSKRDRSGKFREITGYSKCRSVEWIKAVPRHLANPALISVIYSHQTIVDIDKYSKYVNNLIYDFYKLNGEYHLVFEIRNDEVRAMDLFEGIGKALKVVEAVSEENNLKLNTREIKTSINVNSPGTVDFTSVTLALVALGAVIIFLNGGEFTSKKLDIKIGTRGLIKAIQDFLESQKNVEIREEIRRKIEGLKIKNPEDLVKIIESMENKK